MAKKKSKTSPIEQFFREIKNSRVYMMDYTPAINGHIGVLKKFQKNIPNPDFHVLYDKKSKKLAIIKFDTKKKKNPASLF